MGEVNTNGEEITNELARQQALTDIEQVTVNHPNHPFSKIAETILSKKKILLLQ